jgi:hypothetical protein
MPFLGSPAADHARICLLARQLLCLSEKSCHSRQAWRLKTRLLLSGRAKPTGRLAPQTVPFRTAQICRGVLSYTAGPSAILWIR